MLISICKAPIYEKVASVFANEPNCVVAKIDADKEKSIGTEFEISGFPTIKFFPAGASEPVAYEGGRTEAAFVEFLNKHCGTQRVVGGGFMPSAGRIKQLDELAIRFIKDANTRQQVQAEAVEAAKRLYLHITIEIILAAWSSTTSSPVRHMRVASFCFHRSLKFAERNPGKQVL